MTVYVDQKETTWYRTQYEIPDDMTIEAFIQQLNKDEMELEEYNTTGWYIDDSSEPMEPWDNGEQPTLEVRVDSQYTEPVWTNKPEKSEKVLQTPQDFLEEFIDSQYPIHKIAAWDQLERAMKAYANYYAGIILEQYETSISWLNQSNRQK